MAFFGMTHLGYQNPIGDKMIVNPKGASHPQGLSKSLEEQQDTCNVTLPRSYCADTHQGSHERHKEMIKRNQTPRSPNQLYKMPLTDNQQYGWMLSKSPEPWTQVKRFPRKNSEMTKFFEEMSVTDQSFSLL
uniref:testis-expressed protein 49-like n=1 Tax=Scatophagus argus TaxID=75038 RepID=UPI001ED80D3A|nr:testis-expressed protein 49-like [Scatophagus argus]